MEVITDEAKRVRGVLAALDSISGLKPSQSSVDPTEIHERPRANLRRPVQSADTRFGAILLVAIWLTVTSSLAQEQPVPLQPLQSPLQETQSTALNPISGAAVPVHGIVRNAATGEPLPRALVRIEGDADTGTLTDNEGRFELAGVPVGPQTIRVRKPGFQDRPYATEDVDFQGEGPAHNVLVADGMPDLDFSLTPTSAIHGRIEISTGDPAQQIALTLLKQAVRNGRAVWVQRATKTTNGAGAYRFAGLSAGVYALFTVPALESEPAITAVGAGARIVHEGYPTVFYPDAREFSGATRIKLKDGEQAEANLLLTPEPFYTVTAKALLPGGKQLGSGASEGATKWEPEAAQILDTAGRKLAYSGQFDASTRTFQINLPDGSYTLLAGASSGTMGSVFGTEEGQIRRQEFLSGFAEFSVDGHAVSNLLMPFAPSSHWPIHLRIVRTATQTGTNSPQELRNLVMVTAINAGDAPMGEAGADLTTESATPEMLELPATTGPHWLSIQVGDRSLCVDSFTAGGINLAREPLDVAPGSSAPPMELTLHDDCAKLNLNLPYALSAFLPGDEPFYTVYIVPDFDTTVDIPPMNMHPSSGATLTVDGLAPGSYHVYVFDRPVRLEYRNPAAIAALPTQGQAVTLTAGTSSDLVLEVPER